MPAAVKEYTDSVLVDAWRCTECGGDTYDTSGFEVPKFCCRCGVEFIALDYKEAKET